MSEEQVDGIDDPKISDEGGNDDAGDTGDTKTVSYEALRRVLGEKKKTQAQLREAREKLAEYEDKDEATRLDKLKAEGDFTKLSEELKTKLATTEDELTSYKTTVQNSYKFNSIKQTLGADIDHKWFDVLEAKGIYTGIEVSDDGRPEEMSVTKVCDFIRKEYPEIIRTVQGGKTPAEAPQGTGSLSFEDWKKLPLKEKKIRMKEVMQSESGKH